MAPVIRKRAPDFKNTALINGKFEEITLDSYKGKWLVLAFVPLAFTFVCPTEVVAYAKALPEFHKKNTEVIFASVDSAETLKSWNEESTANRGLGNVSLTLVSDDKHTLSKDYGVFVEDEGVALRGLFIIDPEGVLQQITVNDTPVGRNVDETLRLIDAFQFTKEHGEVCPVNWKAGEETIDTKNSDKYFSTK